jgi:hypothetical protein
MTNQRLRQVFFSMAAGRGYPPTPCVGILKDFRFEMTVFSGVSLSGVHGSHSAEVPFLERV